MNSDTALSLEVFDFPGPETVFYEVMKQLQAQMRWSILMVMAGVIAAGLLACNSNETLLSQKPANQAPPAGTPSDNARRIGVEELHKLWQNNDVYIIDTRAESAYKQEHIKGSVSMPTGTVLDHISELPKNKLIAAYCTWPNEHTSAGAVLELKTKGIDNAAALLGGLAAWKNAGYPVEGDNVKK